MTAPSTDTPRRLYVDTSAYLCILLAEEGAERLSAESAGAELLSSVLLVLEARRNLIRLARDGFAITPRLFNALATQGSLGGFSSWGRQQFYLPDGTPKPVGTILRNPALADLLTRLARRGPEAFYSGPDGEAR